jgi:hypothetical protein
VPTPEERDRTITLVSDGFAAGLFDVDELERRVTVAHTTEDADDLLRLEADLGALAPVRSQPAPVTALVEEREVRPHMDMWAIMGGAQRQGTWAVPRELKVVAIMGGCELDFREARFPEGTVDVHITAIMGGVQILVPPNLAVEMNGSAVMGGFDHVSRTRVAPDPRAPLLRIHGLAVMGGVEVRTRLPGESGWQARMRAVSERFLPSALEQMKSGLGDALREGGLDPHRLWHDAYEAREARRAARREAHQRAKDARRAAKRHAKDLRRALKR